MDEHVAPERWAIGSSEWAGLSKLTEEAGEVLQVVGKLLAVGGESEHWSGDLREMLVDELADLLAATHFVVQANFTVEEKLRFGERTAVKHQTFIAWHDEQTAPEEAR